MTHYEPEHAAYLFSPKTSLFKTSGKKIGVIDLGPLVVCKTIDKLQYILMDVKG